MSFLQQLEGETPALTLEETLAFLDSFDDSFDDSQLSGCTSGSSTTSSPGYEDSFDDCDVDMDMDDLLSSATTVAGGSSGSERSWSDSEDGYSGSSNAVSTPKLPSQDETVSVTGGNGGSVAKKTTKAKPATATPQQIQPKQRQKRKAAASTNVSPRAGSKPDGAADDETPTSTVKRRTRKQPKTEILRLRDQVEELQVRLAQLRKAGGGPSDGASGQMVQVNNSARTEIKRKTDESNAIAIRSPQPESASMWLDHAVDQYKALQKAEALNVKLKAEVKRQSSLGKSLKALFTKKTAQHGLDFVTELEPRKTSSNGLASGELWENQKSETEDDTDLYKSIENMHIETDNVQRNIAPEGDVGSVLSSSKTKQDKVFGPVFELKTNTPVKFADFRHLAHRFWAGAMNASDIVLAHPDSGPSENEAHIARDLYERPVSMKLQSQLGELTVNGVAVMCKVEEVHRSVFTFAATLAVAGNSTLVFREYGWMIVAPFETDTSSSLFQTFYRLHTEKRTEKAKTGASADASSTETPASASESAVDNDSVLRDIVMKMLSDTMRSFQNGVQNTLLAAETSTSIEKLDFPTSCPLQKFKLKFQG